MLLRRRNWEGYIVFELKVCVFDFSKNNIFSKNKISPKKFPVF